MQEFYNPSEMKPIITFFEKTWDFCDLPDFNYPLIHLTTSAFKRAIEYEFNNMMVMQ